MLSSRARSLSNFFHVSKPTPLLMVWKSMWAVRRVVSFRLSSMGFLPARWVGRSRYSNLISISIAVGTSPPIRGDRMATIQRYAAKGVWDPPTYAQGVKVTGARTILYIAGQVAYDHNAS